MNFLQTINRRSRLSIWNNFSRTRGEKYLPTREGTREFLRSVRSRATTRGRKFDSRSTFLSRIPEEDDLEMRYSGAIKLVIVYSNDHPLLHYECNRKPETDPCSREPRGRGS